MSLSNYLENKLLDHVFHNTSYTSPTTVYVSLHSADPGETGASELAVANGYARQSCAFSAASGGATENSGTVTFTNTGSAWSAATHFGVWDASSSGNFLGGGSLAASKTVGANDTATFAAGDLDVSLD
jgi:hypothetical protein